MSITLSQLLSQCTELPPTLRDIVKFCNLDDAIRAVHGDLKKLSPSMQELIKQERASVTELNLYSITLTEEMAQAIFNAFPNLKQLTVQQEAITIQRIPRHELDTTHPYQIAYIPDASPFGVSNSSVETDEEHFFSRLIEELNTDRSQSHCQYSVVVTIPANAFR